MAPVPPREKPPMTLSAPQAGAKPGAFLNVHLAITTIDPLVVSIVPRANHYPAYGGFPLCIAGCLQPLARDHVAAVEIQLIKRVERLFERRPCCIGRRVVTPQGK